MKRNVLTDREVQILDSLAAGLTTQETADRIYLSLDTVKTHLRRAYRKLNVRTATGAVVAAHELGYIALKCPEQILPPVPNSRGAYQHEPKPLPPRGYEPDAPPVKRVAPNSGHRKKWVPPIRQGGKLVDPRT